MPRQTRLVRVGKPRPYHILPGAESTVRMRLTGDETQTRAPAAWAIALASARAARRNAYTEPALDFPPKWCVVEVRTLPVGPRECIGSPVGWQPLVPEVKYSHHSEGLECPVCQPACVLRGPPPGAVRYPGTKTRSSEIHRTLIPPTPTAAPKPTRKGLIPRPLSTSNLVFRPTAARATTSRSDASVLMKL